MSDDSLTTRVLIEIRDEIRELRRDTNDRFEQTNGRLDKLTDRVERGFEQTNGRLDALRNELNAEMVALETRQATRVHAQTAATRDLYGLLQDRFELRDRVERCEQRIEQLEKRVD